MSIQDEPIEKFYPVCILCGEQISEDGYYINGDWYCEDCIESSKASGYEEAEDRREAAFEEAGERIYAE